ncbi:amino acid permease-domain-containing protein [Aspergillus ambiguus]|uniref:high affinity methionine permease n=1 Tax=Aspergillus ambiguus TaxID=176160 RepID=UPI003CCCFFCC
MGPSLAKATDATADDHRSDDASVIHDGNLKYMVGEGANSSRRTYQEASGAPIETTSPLGYSVGFVTVVFLNMGKMIGTGVFSTPSTIVKGVGSVGLSLFYWVIGYLMAASTLSVYLEFASYFPSRSGSEVVYLEQSFPRPRYFFPTVFAMQTVIFSFSSSNCVVLAFDTKWSLRLCNAIGIVKLIVLIFIGITGLVVLGGNTSIPDPTVNFRHAFEGSSAISVYGATNALVKVMFSFAGFENAFNVVNEVRNPVKTLKWSAPTALLLTATLYILANIAYFSAGTKEEILNSEAVAASVFFEKVFGTSSASRALNFFICVSVFGNLITVLVGSSRMLRECGRQGVLPFTMFWTSTWPFGTPLGPYAVKWATTVLMILIPPAGDAFNFVVDLGVYPTSFFTFLLSVGLLATRYRRKHLSIPRSEYRAWDVAVIFSILSNLYMLVAPWYPPTTGATGGDVSFWYATYCVVGLGIVAFCGAYYYVWIKILPKHGGYQFRQTVIQLDGGAIAHQLVKVPNEQLAEWDMEHDAIGRVRRRLLHGSEEDIKA